MLLYINNAECENENLAKSRRGSKLSFTRPSNLFLRMSRKKAASALRLLDTPFSISTGDPINKCKAVFTQEITIGELLKRRAHVFCSRGI